MGLALQHYARLAADTYAEQRAAEIRRRAERRAGELLSKMPKAKPPSGKGQAKNDRRSSQATDGPRTLADLGISTQQASQWQRVAAMPEPEFEAAAGFT
jgi:hypothetical protein